jgi:hypothetical protein
MAAGEAGTKVKSRQDGRLPNASESQILRELALTLNRPGGPAIDAGTNLNYMLDFDYHPIPPEKRPTSAPSSLFPGNPGHLPFECSA